MRWPAALASIVAATIALQAATAGPPDERNQPLPPPAQGPAIDPAKFDPLKDPVTNSLTVTHIEITQGIQDIDHSVPILEGRRTFARVYFDGVMPAGWGQVSGKLNVVGPDGSPVSVDAYSSISSLAQWNGQLELKRSWDGLGLLFELPAGSVRAGQLSINLASASDMWNAGAAIPCDNCATLTRSVAVSATAPLRLTVIGLQYDQNGRSFSPAQIDYDLIQSWLVRSYPINGLVYNTRVVPAANPAGFTCDAANAQVAQIRALDINGGTDRRTHYYALVADGGFFMRGCATDIPGVPTPATVASGPTGPGTWGWDTDGSYGDWYTGHELGHTLGRRHVGGICREAGIDPNYPFAGGQLADAAHPFVGYDIGDPNFPAVLRRAEPGRVSPYPDTPVNIWNDVMSYCARQWLSSYTYEAIRDRLVAENALPGGPELMAAAAGAAPPTGGPLVHIVARLGDGWTSGTIDSLSRVSRAEPNPPAPADAPVVAMLDARGRVVSRTPVAVHIFRDLPTEGNSVRPAALVNAALPMAANVRTIRVEYGGKVIASRSGTSVSPKLSARRPGPLLKFTAEAQAQHGTLLQWSGAHAQGRSLTYAVMLSGDGGRTWETQAVGLTKAEFPIPAEALSRIRQGDAAILYRIVASDGFNSSTLSGQLP